ncbi:CobW/HypB/UreG, nucleotide-binding domain [Roseovarius litoreus]|uniref:CobW/HypB/UreG, nucleotide-binding domain n=1 Tax=Roseovarius litoreus TaxID=1155722 RepID=A0A1M7J5L3_9RHOB|nr:GTP-binding protein [Roseovarius litoreus]SHM48191.1 CobW/HypB/UreG, nucleotide-binding domain [Roseovarius litoreus]
MRTATETRSPANVLSGFPKAGRTTPMNSALGSRKGRRVAVIVNDRSEADTEAVLLRGVGADLIGSKVG